MATAAYTKWVRAGKPFTLARPIANIQAYCEKHGIPIKGTIGNEAHLKAATPEDHTPFSATAWPDPLPGYFVCAIDSEDDTKDLGTRFREAAQRGEYDRWLKYFNVDNKHYRCQNAFKDPTYSSDEHLHVSIRTDALNLDISSSFDPLGKEDMALTDTDVKKFAFADVWPSPDNRSDPKNEYFSLATYVKEQMEALNTMLPMVKRVDRALTTTPLADIEAALQQQNAVIRVAIQDALTGVDLGDLTAESVAVAVVDRIRTALNDE